MKNLKELEKKYEELGKEIERLKEGQETVGFKNDPIFLLSAEEYGKYKDKIPQINCWWWLRYSDYSSDRVAFVVGDGTIFYSGHAVDNDTICVRPALRVSNFAGTDLQRFISTTTFNPPFYYEQIDRVVFNGVTWVRIDKDLYISELPIGFQRFDEKSNDYETSEVRKTLLSWFERRQELN